MSDRDPDIARLQQGYADLLARLEANEGRFRHLARTMFRVQEDERRRLARELHDGLGQNLTALKHQLALALAELGGAAPPRLADALGLCEQTLADTRELSRLLRPQVLDDLGLLPALRWLGRTLGQPAGLDVRVDAGDLPPLDEDLNTLVFRLAQEALTNTVRHARAQHAGFRLSAMDGRLHFEAWDDGAGFDPARALDAGSRGQSTGIGAMHERAGLHGGRLRLHSRPGAGTRIVLDVPLPGEAGRLAP